MMRSPTDDKLLIGLKNDALLLSIVATAIGLTLLVTGIAFFWGSGSVLAELPWYIPLISAFTALTTLIIAYLALGRYQVTGDSVAFWVGTGFATYSIGQIFYALTWPGLLPDGGSILGQFANTPAFIALVDLTLLNAFLLAAVFIPTRWPHKQSFTIRRWHWPVIGWLLFIITGFVLIIYFESYLPVFSDEQGRFTSSLRIWTTILLLGYLAGSVLSTLYYQRSGDRLVGYIVFPQMALVFICVMLLIGGKRYDLWWYVQRVVLVGGYLTVLFGLLSEHIRLLQREREGRRMLEGLLEYIPIGLTVTDGPPDFRIAHVSRHGLELNQLEKKDLIGWPTGQNRSKLRIFLADGVREAAPEQRPLYRASQFGEVIQNVEFMMETREGQRIPVLVNAAPIRDPQGNIVAAISTWLDITDRRRAEQTLRESEALYRAIARSIPNGGVFVVDRDLRYIIAEGVVAEKFGYTQEMLEGRTVSEVFDADLAARMEARFRRAFAGETISYETELNGRVYWTQHALIDDPARHAIVITLDVTERRQAEKALSETEQRFQAIINQTTAGVVRSNNEGVFVFVNQAFCEMLRFSEAELIGKTIWQITHPEDLEENKRLFDRLIEKGRAFQLEKRLLRKDGSILWVNVSASPILDGLGNTQSTVSIVVDITERKQAEQELQQLNLELESRVEKRTAELQAANRALLENRERLQVLSQRLVTVQEEERRAIARELHDRVGQTLAALNINLIIINNQLLEDSKQRIGSRMDDSMSLVAEAIALVRDVMTDLRPTVLEDYGLEAALQSYIDHYQSRYPIKVQLIRSNPPLPRLETSLEMTLLRIAQEALTNVARHAQADQANVSLHLEAGVVQLRVQDSGVGIDTLQAANRPDSHGLKIMRERAEAFGGSVNIRSTLGKGTTVEATIPHSNGSQT